MTNAICKKKDVLVWGPAKSDEPIEILAEWIRAVEAAGFENIFLVVNGQDSMKVCQLLANEANGCKAKIEWLSGPASIGLCQTFVTDLFLKSKAKYMLRIDPDGQFPIQCETIYCVDLKSLAKCPLMPLLGSETKWEPVAVRDTSGIFCCGFWLSVLAVSSILIVDVTFSIGRRRQYCKVLLYQSGQRQESSWLSKIHP